jgi:chitin disaccharide deacetylase
MLRILEFSPIHKWAIARFVLAGAMLLTLTGQLLGQTQQTWAERLGYGADKRVVILHASGGGLCYEANAAVATALAEGSASSAAVMAACPWFEDFTATKLPADADVGLTITFTADLERYRWTSVSPRGDVPGLIDSDGYLRRSAAEFAYNTTPTEIGREIDAQLAKARANGLRPSHLTCHQGVVFVRADLAAIYLEAARRHWIPAVVIELTPQRLREFQDQGLPIDDEMLHLVANYPLPKIDDIRLVPRADSYEEKRAQFLKQLGELSPGITQFVARPAVESAALARLSPDAEQQVWDARLLGDAEVKKLLGEKGIVLTNWREIMRRFEGERPGARPREELEPKPVDEPAKSREPPRENP